MLGTVRSLPASDLISGRSTAAVASQWASAPATVVPYLNSMQQATDNTTPTPVLPATPITKVMNNANYAVNVYLGWCYVTDGGAGPNACARHVVDRCVQVPPCRCQRHLVRPKLRRQVGSRSDPDVRVRDVDAGQHGRQPDLQPEPGATAGADRRHAAGAERVRRRGHRQPAARRGRRHRCADVHLAGQVRQPATRPGDEHGRVDLRHHHRTGGDVGHRPGHRRVRPHGHRNVQLERAPGPRGEQPGAAGEHHRLGDQPADRDRDRRRGSAVRVVRPVVDAAARADPRDREQQRRDLRDALDPADGAVPGDADRGRCDDDPQGPGVVPVDDQLPAAGDQQPRYADRHRRTTPSPACSSPRAAATATTDGPRPGCPPGWP